MPRGTATLAWARGLRSSYPQPLTTVPAPLLEIKRPEFTFQPREITTGIPSCLMETAAAGVDGQARQTVGMGETALPTLLVWSSLPRVPDLGD